MGSRTPMGGRWLSFPDLRSVQGTVRPAHSGRTAGNGIVVERG